VNTLLAIFGGVFIDELLAATARGVKVRLLMDHMGSRSIPEYKGFVASWTPRTSTGGR
jgi:phosphatidylserine/phosphatidylglycerophosphate/cardiolipin synthase-like enzyme